MRFIDTEQLISPDTGTERHTILNGVLGVIDTSFWELVK
jgi:hypothetical protein